MRLARLLLVFLLLPSTAPAFDLDAYRRHLEAVRNLGAGEFLASHAPYGPYVRALEPLPAPPRFFAEIDSLFALTPGEEALLAQNGFMASERLTYPTYGHAFLRVWQADLPVFVSSDAILNAVHRSYTNLLSTIESSYLSLALDAVLGDLHTAWPQADAALGGVPGMREALDDADVYLTVARSLLRGGAVPSGGGNDDAVREILALVGQETPAAYPLFNDVPRLVDWSQFRPRGHYAGDPDLERYFQAMIWLGRTEFRLTVPPGDGAPPSVDREILGAFVVRDLVSRSGAAPGLAEIDRVIRALVGAPDNVTLPELDALALALGVETPSDLLAPGLLDRVASELRTGAYSPQAINSQILMKDPMNPQDLDPPYAFLLLGQRFVVDSYVTWQVVFDRTPSLRMIPSPLDVLYALGNDDALPLLSEELYTWNYAPNLSAVRYLIDGYDDAFWSGSLYNAWLSAIRTLSKSGRQPGAPPFMQTMAWQHEKMNTQLASWAELRHDNLLYAKQSYSGGATCSYPCGYVEPVPALYRTLGGFATRARGVFGDLPLEERTVDRVRTFFDGMTATMDTLAAIADKELAGTALGDAESRFLSGILYHGMNGCVSAERGWYRDLDFTYGDNPLEVPDYIVADVHTAPTDAGGNMVGNVLHVATGRPYLGFFIATPPGGEPTLFAGPIAAYHEHITVDFERLTDREWRTLIETGPPATPAWTQVYLADGEGAARQAESPLSVRPEPQDPRAPEAPPVPLLAANHPNPFVAGTLLSFRAPGNGAVRLDVFDAQGRRVRALVEETLSAGTYHVRWDGADDRGRRLPAGVYVACLRAGTETAVRKMTLLP